MSEWQPIETAPRDGTRIILFGRYNHSHFVSDGHFWTRITDEIPVVAEGYRCANLWQVRGGVFPDEHCTHWMPLPNPPVD